MFPSPRTLAILDGMNPCFLLPLCALPILLLSAPGCEPTAGELPERPAEQAKPAETRVVPAGKNVSIEIQGDRRRVLIKTEVCLVKGPLELLLCKNQTKEHEAILHGDFDAHDIHKALLVAGAEPGAPVQYQPAYKPARGSKVKVLLQYEQKGKLVTVPAKSWVRDMKTGKELQVDWVFAGSQLVKDGLDPKQPPFYLANGGDVICVSNFEDALLDLPIESSKVDADRQFEAFEERIPPLETKVTVILEPVLGKKK